VSSSLELAEKVANSLGINVYVREDGKIAQHPPGQEVRAPASSKPTLSHGGDRTLAADHPAG
jgi:hypothetical protein